MAVPNKSPRSVIYIPHRREQERWERVCTRDIINRGARTVAVIAGTSDGDRWHDAEAMIKGGEADEIVVGRWDHVPAESLPHVRVVAEEACPPTQRRPRVIE